jgi:PAS domain S-box-containing protein
MKKPSILVSTLVVLFLLNCADAIAAEPESMPNPLRVSIDKNYPPYSFVDSNNSLAGYSVDLWKLWEKKTGVPVELHSADLEDAISALTERKTEVIDSIFTSANREQFLDFSKPYAKIPVNIYTHDSLGGIVDTESLNGFMVGVKAGDACIEKLESAGIHSLARYQNYKNLILAAQSGQIKAFCMDEPTAEHLLYKAGAHRYFRSAFKLYSGELHRAVRRASGNTMQFIETGFSQISDAELQVLDEKWMGRNLASPLEDRDLSRAFVALLLGGGGLAFFGFFLAWRRSEELERERNHMRTLVRTLPDLVWLKNRDGVILACNPALADLHGMSEEDLIGKTDHDLLDKEAADYVWQHDLLAISTRKPCVNEEWFTSKKTDLPCLFETTKAPMYAKNGELVGILGIARDITERRQTENALRVSEQKFSAAFRSSPDAIIISQACDGRIIEVNEAFLRLSGFRREELIGRNGVELDLWGGSERRDECFRRLREAGWIRDVEGEFRIKSGELRWGLTSAEVIEIDSRPHILWVVRDFTEKRNTDNALRASEQKFAAAFRACPDAIAIFVAEDCRIIVDVNDAMTSLTGFEREEMIGASAVELKLWLDQEMRESYLSELHERGRVFEMEASFRIKNGEIRQGLLSAEPIIIDGRLHTLGIFHDITLRRAAEKELRAANHRLTALSARLLKIQEEERRNLAHELHDEIGQSITAQKIVLQTLCIGQKNSTFCDQIAAVIRITDTVLNQVRRISLDLRPAQLDDLGLPAAIRWNLMRQSRLAGFVPHFSAMDVPAVLPESIAIACYRISQEALTNAIRHGHAQNVWLSLKGGCAELQLEIRDDGEGFDPLLLEVGESMGMIGMQERAILANGQLAVCAQPGAGCMIVAKFAL